MASKHVVQLIVAHNGCYWEGLLQDAPGWSPTAPQAHTSTGPGTGPGPQSAPKFGPQDFVQPVSASPGCDLEGLLQDAPGQIPTAPLHPTSPHPDRATHTGPKARAPQAHTPTGPHTGRSARAPLVHQLTPRQAHTQAEAPERHRPTSPHLDRPICKPKLTVRANARPPRRRPTSFG